MVHSKMDCLCCSATCELQMYLNHQRLFNSIHKTTFGMLFYSNLCVSNVQSHSSLEPYVMPVLLVVLFTAKHDLLLLRATWRVWRVCMSCVNSEWEDKKTNELMSRRIYNWVDSQVATDMMWNMISTHNLDLDTFKMSHYNIGFDHLLYC